MSEEPTLGEIGRHIKALDARVQKVLDDHESRLRGIERWMYAVPASLFGAISAIVIAVMSKP